MHWQQTAKQGPVQGACEISNRPEGNYYQASGSKVLSEHENMAVIVVSLSTKSTAGLLPTANDLEMLL